MKHLHFKEFLKAQYIILFIITGLFGVINHFLYDWTDGNYLIGLFTPINESIFEHLKLLFFPFMFFSFLEVLLLNKKIENIMPYRVFNITLSIIFLPITYYIFKSIGFQNDIFNISLYFIFLFISTYLSYQNEKKNNEPSKIIKIFSLILFVLLIITFVVCTINPPDLELFQDPLMA